MNPIPLASPNGQIYAYACGTCHHVSAGSSLLAWSEGEGDGPHKRLTESSLIYAAACCTCHWCRRPAELEKHVVEYSDDLVVARAFACVTCSSLTSLVDFWRVFEDAYTHGVTTLEGWHELVADRWKDDDQ